ncbi:hypothetical protein SLEP1_g48048 [Rubroshorea leprosula]|uniref:Nucleolar protein 58 n=1 Tax=Rubroshorea leprosula TaxID=152421 RepID=A0AAV5LTC7_9ROSI|nr:hypothetical protein SLEP1_g48048 [Rubroshorea leprosula]
MIVLFETPAGFALFKVLDEGKLSKVEDLQKDFLDADSARKFVKLKAFSKFENTAEALEAATKLIDGAPSKGLRKFLKAHCEGETLGVADSKLGNAIKEKLKIECVHSNAVMELLRGVRSQLTDLISGLAVQDLAPMSLGLSHSLSRYKLKFSADKVDTMIVQAIGLLDDLDKELNTYAMRVREWYGWHFPELVKIVQDNILYAKTVKLMGDRANAAKLDFSEILPEEVETELKEAAVISMGTEVSDLDLINIKELCDQVLSLAEYRAQLYDYLKSRMNTVAPNLTALVGELVGARLIAHGGSLLNLAKQPGSTVQILGAEKALFRALKTKHATPKYGLIYHASVVGQAAPKHKGKISRSLAAKAALAIRCDALGDSQDNSMGLENRAKARIKCRTSPVMHSEPVNGVPKMVDDFINKPQIVQNVTSPWVSDYKQSSPTKVEPIATNGSVTTPANYPKINEFFNTVQTEASRPRLGPLGATYGYGGDLANKAGQPRNEAVMISSGGWSRPRSHVTWASPPEGSSPNPTNGINTAIEYPMKIEKPSPVINTPPGSQVATPSHRSRQDGEQMVMSRQLMAEKLQGDMPTSTSHLCTQKMKLTVPTLTTHPGTQNMKISVPTSTSHLGIQKMKLTDPPLIAGRLRGNMAAQLCEISFSYGSYEAIALYIN